MITLTQNYQICHINIKNIYMQYMLLLCPLCTGTLTRKSSTIITLLPSPLQKSVKLSGCWIEMGMALYPSRSWAWRCARWDICPVRWSWRLSCNASTWTVSTHSLFFSVTSTGWLSQCVAAHVWGSESSWSLRNVLGGCLGEVLPFTTSKDEHEPSTSCTYTCLSGNP